MKLAAQMFTVRDYAKDLDGLENTLGRIADIGYEYVQVSGTCPYEPEWLREKLDKYGLECVITHIPSERICADTEKVIAEHNVFGCDIIGVGAMPDVFNKNVSMEQAYNSFVEKFVPAAKKIAAAGKKLSYHNHDAEFMRSPATGTIYFERLMTEIPPELLCFTLDTYWVQFGGKDPATVIRELKGRCPVVHFKDYLIDRDDPEQHQHTAVCGEGNLDFEGIIEACRYAGTEYVTVEQDLCYGEDPFDCLKRSRDYLLKMGI